MPSLPERFDRFAARYPWKPGTCEVCDGRGYGWDLASGICSPFEEACICRHCERGRAWAEELRQHKLAKMLALSTPPEAGEKATPTFENFNTDVHPDHWYAWHAVKMRVDGEWPDDEPIGIFLWGESGRGKTHLARAAETALNALHVPVLFITWLEFLNRQKAGYELKDGSGFELLQVARKVDVLILDELSLAYIPEKKQLANEYDVNWASSHLFDIIDARVKAGLRTIITSNRAPDSPQAPMDLRRLYGMPVVSRLLGNFLVFHMQGPDMRKQTQFTLDAYKARYAKR